MDTITRTDLQLQLWDSDLRAYVPAPSDAVRTRSWRLVDPAKNRVTKNPKYNPPRYAGYSRSQEDVQRAYLQWAQAKGLTAITAYSNRPPPNFAADTIVGYHKWRADKTVPLFTGEIAYITLEAHFAVEESTI